MSNEAGEKKYDPSEQKLRKAREQGNYVKLPFSFSVFPFFIAISMTMWLLPSTWLKIQKICEQFTVSSSGLREVLGELCYASCGVLFLPLFTAALASLAVQWVALRPTLTFQPLAFNLTKLAPWSGVQRIVKDFKPQIQIVSIRLLLGLYLVWWFSLNLIMKTAEQPIAGSLRLDSLGFLLQQAIMPWLALCFVSATVELLVRLRSHRKELSMTEKEMREEHKESEGDPHMKSERKHQHMILSMQELERRVRSSTVLIIEKGE